MSLKTRVESEMKTAMKARDKDRLRALKAIKALILLAQTSEGSTGELSENEEVKLLMKAVKQRKDSAQIYQEQGREDLEQIERSELAVIEEFLPQMLSEAELTQKLQDIIARVGATSPKDMGKVMGMATQELAGKAEGKAISTTVKNLLNQ